MNDASDHNIPKMIWFGLEPLVVKDPDGALKLAVDSNIPLITEFIVRRLVDADMVEGVVANIQKALCQPDGDA